RAEGGLAKVLGQAACADAPPELHLPEAILGVDVALREEEVVRVLRVDVGHAVRVAENFNRGGQAGHADRAALSGVGLPRSEEHTSELQSRENLVCRLLLETK